jgi:beta-N-acetylhexosaminidase
VTPQDLRDRELPPFAAVIAADAKAIMTAHIRVPSITGTDPATFTARSGRPAARRVRLHRHGVNALVMKRAAIAAGGIGRAATRLAAGADCSASAPRERRPGRSGGGRDVAALGDGRLGQPGSRRLAAPPRSPPDQAVVVIRPRP